ncbi:hypothetical protein TNCV_521381 [Trichonephila clavipes]|nr:hypothetical protein TNCV_521381 [Trichonephila clavipes]
MVKASVVHIDTGLSTKGMKECTRQSTAMSIEVQAAFRSATKFVCVVVSIHQFRQNTPKEKSNAVRSGDHNVHRPGLSPLRSSVRGTHLYHTHIIGGTYCPVPQLHYKPSCIIIQSSSFTLFFS